jgi:PIN domain nuclease of toxin-antitoxin system
VLVLRNRAESSAADWSAVQRDDAKAIFLTAVGQRQSRVADGQNYRGDVADARKPILTLSLSFCFLSAVGKLPRPVAEAIVDPENQVFVSAASAWEIAIKAAIGKIEAEPKAISASAQATGFIELPVTFTHGVRVRDLPHHHRDPFDRILVAQAIEEGLQVIWAMTSSIAIRWPGSGNSPENRLIYAPVGLYFRALTHPMAWGIGNEQVGQTAHFFIARSPAPSFLRRDRSGSDGRTGSRSLVAGVDRADP